MYASLFLGALARYITQLASGIRPSGSPIVSTAYLHVSATTAAFGSASPISSYAITINLLTT